MYITRMMKMKILTTLLVSFLIITLTIIPAAPSVQCAPSEGEVQTDTLDLTAAGAILIEASTGRVLYEHNSHERLEMASTTKIMTAIVVLEHCKLDEVVKVDERAAGIEGSSIYLTAGQNITVGELLYGMMLSSGNDAANALAYYVAGDKDSFADLMNEKAKNLGAYNTHFTNPEGLHNDSHYTTAYDLAMITAYALSMEDFARIVSTHSIRINNPNNPVQKNENKMLYQYEGADGVKTGYTKASGRCLVTSATRNGMQLISVVLKCQPMYEESAALLDYGFTHFEMKKIISQGQKVKDISIRNGFSETVGAVATKDIVLPVRTDGNEVEFYDIYCPNEMEAPIEKGTAVGTVSVDLLSVSDASLLVADSSVERRNLINRLKKWVQSWYH